MSHRQVLESLSGLLLGMFVSILAGTVVSTSMPRIISELHGDQTAYTWVVTSTLLATTVSTPIWGKLADLFNRKLLIQLALGLFVVGSALAGFSGDTNWLIGFRVIQGLGAGGLTALSQIIMADIISPRERGRYMGLFGGIMAVGTVGGPLIGGLLTDSIGWRWNFFVGVPVAIIAIILLQATLKLPKRPARKVRIDYLGAVFLAAGVSLLLIWVSLAGKDFEWASWTTAWMVGGAVLLLIATVITELVVKEPIIPLGMFKNRTFTLAVIASISVGVAMFGTSVFLGQYMQVARGATPTESGLLTLPMIFGLLISSTVVGNLISRFGKYKAFMVVGAILLTVGLYLMSTIEYDTNYLLVSVYMLVLGAGVGMVMQNLVLIVQNTVAASQLGAASSNVAFFRSLGGTIGVSVMGSVLGTTVKDLFSDRKDDLIAAATKAGKSGMEALQSLQTGTIPEVNKLPGGIRTIVESVYGQSVADIFLIAVPLAIISIIAIAFLPNIKLGTKTAIQKAEEEKAAGQGAESGLRHAEETVIEVAEALVGSPATGSVPVVSRGDASELQADRPGARGGRRAAQEDR
ncbi:MDR family MFS transporter [Leifsonia sp. F6_8S_P_1B]|uniref:MDR family MFS transporter n=1 Tax=Leifsonia williamsii TaxID=3035919 RepID=A0ABT8K955_9MICO|nr:MDR family MFS transporter [Leifsonia williamsii]MDN4613924.1 MDR family MFS transporter [Leifsonia williamsii]